MKERLLKIAKEKYPIPARYQISVYGELYQNTQYDIKEHFIEDARYNTPQEKINMILNLLSILEYNECNVYAIGAGVDYSLILVGHITEYEAFIV